MGDDQIDFLNDEIPVSYTHLGVEKMKRKREILIGVALILITLVVLGWMSGYYLSPQACVEDSLRGLYFSPAEKIDEVQIGDRYYYLYANDHQYALHGARKTAGIFYVTTGGSTHLSLIHIL